MGVWVFIYPLPEAQPGTSRRVQVAAGALLGDDRVASDGSVVRAIVSDAEAAAVRRLEAQFPVRVMVEPVSRPPSPPYRMRWATQPPSRFR